MALKDILPGDKKNNKTIPVSHSKDHPDVKTPGGKKNRKKAMGGGMMDMTRMKYLKGGQV